MFDQNDELTEKEFGESPMMKGPTSPTNYGSIVMVESPKMS